MDGLNDEEIFDRWVQQVCGAKERYCIQDEDVQDPLYLNEYMAAQAAKVALQDANLETKAIDHLIYSSTTSRVIVPPPSCTLQHYLGLENVSGFTLNSACNGFVDAIIDATIKIHSGAYKNVLVVSSENMCRHVRWDDPRTAILFSDGAGACVIGPSEKKVLSFASRIQFNNEHMLLTARDPLVMKGGPLVQRKAVHAMSTILQVALEKASLDLDAIDFIIPHQANRRILQAFEKKLNLPQGSKVVDHMHLLPNSSSASIPIVYDFLRKGKIPNMPYHTPCIVAFVGVGGGYTYSAVLMEC